MSERRSAKKAGTNNRPLEPFDPKNDEHRVALAEVAERGLLELGGSSEVILVLQKEYRLFIDREAAYDVLSAAARFLPPCGEPAGGTTEAWSDDEVARGLFLAAGQVMTETAADFARFWADLEVGLGERDTDELGVKIDNYVISVQLGVDRARHFLSLAYNSGVSVCEEEGTDHFVSRLLAGNQWDEIVQLESEEPFDS